MVFLPVVVRGVADDDDDERWHRNGWLTDSHSVMDLRGLKIVAADRTDWGSIGWWT